MFQQAIEGVSKQCLVRTRIYRFGRAVQDGRVWTNCYYVYPADAASVATSSRVSVVRTIR
jgi:hypothetical protein